MMKVLAISDLHGFLPEIPPCDLLLLGGDYNEKRNIDQQIRFMQGAFKDWLKAIDARYIVGIAGNHDFIFQEAPEKVKDLPWIYLEDSAVDLEGVKIYGTPWTPEFGHWAFMTQENKLKDIFANIPNGLDILLSHGPVRHILDKEKWGTPCGSIELRVRVMDVKPDNFVCGHIHEANGIVDHVGTRFYNVAYVNEKYEPVNHPVMIHLKG